jgi:CheY-like chemotaxis protein
MARARVLLVDDEPAIGRVLTRALEGLHDVEATASGRALLARIAAGERFDVIISDLMMPEMTGMDLHAELRSVAPDQAERMVFLTGGAFTSRARDFLSTVENPVIEKPLERKDLVGAIAAMLERKGRQ